MIGQCGTRCGLAALAVLAVGTGPAWAQAARPVAVVNGEAIMAAEVDAVLAMQGPTATPPTETQKKLMRRQVVEMLVDDVVMKQFLLRELKGKTSLKPNSPAVNKEIDELVAALKAKGNTLEKFLKESGQTEAQLRANVIKHLQWETYVAEHLSLETMKRYYEAYKPFFEKVVVRASHILIRVPENAKDTDRQVAANKLRNLRQEILAGRIDFTEAAKKYSEDEATRADGGDIGFFPRKFMVQESFAQAAFALKKGEVSDLVATDYGLHLIKVVDRSAGEPSTFEKVKDQVHRACMMEMHHAIMERERKAAKVVINLP
jgi:parvulin-like peptidyl-prolyl isomerase